MDIYALSNLDSGKEYHWKTVHMNFALMTFMYKPY